MADDAAEAEGEVKLTEIANRINEHLRRFEADPIINKYRDWRGKGDQGTRPYYNAGACQAGRYVSVRYISYQNSTALPKDLALEYLAWLDAGNVGTHYHAQREKTA